MFDTTPSCQDEDEANCAAPDLILAVKDLQTKAESFMVVRMVMGGLFFDNSKVDLSATLKLNNIVSSLPRIDTYAIITLFDSSCHPGVFFQVSDGLGLMLFEAVSFRAAMRIACSMQLSAFLQRQRPKGLYFLLNSKHQRLEPALSLDIPF